MKQYFYKSTVQRNYFVLKVFMDLLTLNNEKITLFLYFDSNVVVGECPSGTHYSKDGCDIRKDYEEDYWQECSYDLLSEQSNPKSLFIGGNLEIVSLFG